MNKKSVPILLGIVLMLKGAIALAVPVEYTFSTTGRVGGASPLLTGLTSVSGSFTYENGAPIFMVGGPGGNNPGGSFFQNLSNLSGIANGNAFSDQSGITIISDDNYVGGGGMDDLFALNWAPRDDGTLVGFNYAGLSLVNVRFFWIEVGLFAIGDFLDDQTLPLMLPPVASGGVLALDFKDSADALHIAFFSVDIAVSVPEPAALLLLSTGLLGIGLMRRRRRFA